MHIFGKEPNWFSGCVPPGIVWWLPPQVVIQAALRVVLIRWPGPWAQGASASNKPRPGDADAPVINGLLLGLVTLITPCVLSENVDFQGCFHGFITAIARLITAIRTLLQQ